MKIVIVGCGRVGAALAEGFDATGHQVVILDISTRAFDRLSSAFRGSAIRGDGTDEDVLRRAGADGADVFLAFTEGDNRNVMAAQLAVENLGAAKVIAKINDPVRAAAYADLGIATICRTSMLTDAVHEYLGLVGSGLPGVIAPTGRHHGGGDHEPARPPIAGSPASSPAGSGAGSPAGAGSAAEA